MTSYSTLLETMRLSICTKFEVSSFSRSGDIVGETKNLNRSRDYNHAPFGGDFS